MLKLLLPVARWGLQNWARRALDERLAREGEVQLLLRPGGSAGRSLKGSLSGHEVEWVVRRPDGRSCAAHVLAGAGIGAGAGAVAGAAGSSGSLVAPASLAGAAVGAALGVALASTCQLTVRRPRPPAALPLQR